MFTFPSLIIPDGVHNCFLLLSASCFPFILFCTHLIDSCSPFCVWLSTVCILLMQGQSKVQNKPAKALSNYSSLLPKYSIVCSFAQYRPLATINIPYYTYKDCRSAGHGSREGGSEVTVGEAHCLSVHQG